MIKKWVEGRSFLGFDRRKGQSGFRLFDRRKGDESGDPPSLPAALRKLRIRCMEANTPEGSLGFAAATRVVADLARAYHKTHAAQSLQRLAERVAADPRADWRSAAEAEIMAIMERLD